MIKEDKKNRIINKVFDNLTIQQREGEIRMLTDELDNRSINTILEIGVKCGGTLYIWNEFFNPSLLVGIDPYPELEIDISDDNIYLIKQSSHKSTTLEIMKKKFENGIDFLFIDGDHTYNGVKMDFEMYSPLVKDNGIIALHDIQKGAPAIKVPKYWNEIKYKYDSKELISTPQRQGIGLIRLNKNGD